MPSFSCCRLLAFHWHTHGLLDVSIVDSGSFLGTSSLSRSEVVYLPICVFIVCMVHSSDVLGWYKALVLVQSMFYEPQGFLFCTQPEIHYLAVWDITRSH